MTSSSPFPGSPLPQSPFPAAPSPATPSAAPPLPARPLLARQADGQDAAIAGLAPGPSLETIVREAHRQGYSDVHLGVGEGPRFRCRGDIQRTEWPTTDAATFASWLKELLSPTQIDSFRRDKEFDGSFGFGFVRVRINLLETLLGPAMVLRLIPQTIASIEELGLPEVLQEICQRPKGLVLVTGPTGSGKSTTLASMVDHINRTMARHILT
ncbi:MAG: ATPase, T2SS/T4P/T4SS family, partial [Cyanobium sp. LacPavin_0920_WC12_MAG_62_9]|nr:ATPase, T2SS/T4P/T4SS family [Cyanobium sp. LacPavin_0920_WC12_MAG_62_9]